MAAKSGAQLQAAQRRAARLQGARRSERPSERLLGELAITRQVIDTKLLALEPELSASTYVAYRYMSPLARTELFTEAYERLFRQKHAQYFSVVEAEHAKPIDPVYVRNGQRELTSLWGARQQADRLGVPYPLFIRGAVEVAVERWRKKRVPRPNQLYREGQLAQVLSDWERERDTGGHLPRDDWDPRFRAEAFRGDPAQEACLKLIEGRVLGGSSGGRVMRLANFLRQGWIGLDQAAKRFGDEVTDEAASGLSECVAVSGLNATAHSPYLPPCLGLVASQNALKCSGCPYRELCRRFGGKTDVTLLDRLGTTDPRREAHMQSNRERQRRFRERRRQSKQVGAGGSDCSGVSA
jgi:hypothetical protein